ncbi:unnamed protein product, partial [marine sediment metagenome]
MGIESPATYGDYYWKNSVEATEAFDEVMENALSPYLRGIFADIPGIRELPSGLQSFMRAMAEPPTAGFGDLIKLTAGEFGAEILKDAIAPAMSMMKRF